jgi:hypothetical protein
LYFNNILPYISILYTRKMNVCLKFLNTKSWQTSYSYMFVCEWFEFTTIQAGLYRRKREEDGAVFIISYFYNYIFTDISFDLFNFLLYHCCPRDFLIVLLLQIFLMALIPWNESHIKTNHILLNEPLNWHPFDSIH